ncbi:MAG: ABC transporter ATP-binding protein [Rhodospirillales bacterium]|jgi:general nucleoside transport system ATP-binding protein|nr:ABC transporter ATP-binding protein [Rhodospirillales bacterium]MBT4041770.1 ABC transporter ATP-binding protein [Rhodospirillales bacterium]MBT4626064.1 ABC transporter ATP-binding protein [Rhodospirillales bacterium]MBT5521548.1 ABC transporter ATP-binding protein [Rhodospirillales bacterium]MBT6108883.1 ABC transporter ATP-binding protein [Rhodospirillales bacterium]
MTETALLELSGITKRFPGVIANDGVGFSIAPGQVHALLGENGAGKSTLVKMIYGVMHPDEGSMTFDGQPYHPAKPSEARQTGVGMVFQHFSLFEALSVAENVALGMDKAMSGGDLDAKIIEVSEAYGLPLDPTRLVGSLSVGERQRVEIVRCLLQNPRLLIMDEPTSVLTPQEVDILFETLRKLSAEGCSILYISHKLEEIRNLCDHATVLRGGKVVGSCDPRQETAKSLAEMMIGATLTPPERQDVELGPERLAVSNLSRASDDPFGVDLHDVSLSVCAGEILGIAGVAGNGQNELMEALIGEVASDLNGTIMLNGEMVGHRNPTERRAQGMCFVPEERLGHGAVPDMALWENTILSARTRKQIETNGFLNNDRAKSFADEVVAEFNVKTSGIEHAASSLSGGNLQKFIVGREILQAPDVLVVSQPTWGVDAGAAADIHRALQELARNGTAILVISQDLDELMAISTRFAVISEGRLSAPQPTGQMSVEEIGLLMGGVHNSVGQSGEAHHA